MKLWEADFCLGNVSLQRLELHAKRGGKNETSRGSHFSPFFLNYFEPSDASFVDMSLWVEWAGLPLWFWAWLMAKGHFFLYFCFRWLLGLMGSEPLANFWGFGLGLPWTEKTGLYNGYVILCIWMLNLISHYTSQCFWSSGCSIEILILLQGCCIQEVKIKSLCCGHPAYSNRFSTISNNNFFLYINKKPFIW